METVTNIANTATTAATKLIWGDRTAENETGGQEPVSGVEGKGTIDEPYDQGNKENPTVLNNTNHTSDAPLAYRPKHADNELGHNPKITSDIPVDSSPKDTTDSKTTDISNKDVDNILKDTSVTPLGDNIEDTTSKPGDNLRATASNPGITASTKPTLPSDKDISPSDSKMSSPLDTKHQSIPKNPNNAAEGGPIHPEHNTDKTGIVGNMGSDPHGSVVNPSSSSTNPGAAPDSGGGSFVPKQQGADKPNDAPADHENDAVRQTKLDAEKALKAEENLSKNRDPNDHSGEPMHMHDGKDHSGGVPSSQAERRDSKAGMPGGQEHGKTYGTGEQWVKTTGVAAEGGDFDVTKPGAGREATRILEEKGIHKSGAGDQDTGTSEGKEKVSVGEKIKNKLHIGSHHK